MTIATTTLVSVSTARYRRARATSATIPATTALPACRLRPWGTRQYSMLTSRPVSVASDNTG
jgi:hypothetical protein